MCAQGWIVRKVEFRETYRQQASICASKPDIPLGTTAIEARNLGNWQPIEGDISELRVNFGPGYRRILLGAVDSSS